MIVPDAPHFSFRLVDRLKQPFEAGRMINRPGTAEAHTKQLQLVRCEQTDGYDLTIRHPTSDIRAQRVDA